MYYSQNNKETHKNIVLKTLYLPLCTGNARYARHGRSGFALSPILYYIWHGKININKYYETYITGIADAVVQRFVLCRTK